MKFAQTLTLFLTESVFKGSALNIPALSTCQSGPLLNSSNSFYEVGLTNIFLMKSAWYGNSIIHLTFNLHFGSAPAKPSTTNNLLGATFK